MTGERAAPERAPLCPSAQPDWNGAVAFGVVNGNANRPQVVYLRDLLRPSEKLLSLAKPVQPTEVFRFAAGCMCKGCQHFEDAHCNLATKIAANLRPVVEELPECGIRDNCRWFLQEGGSICLRCPQVVTDNTNPSMMMRYVSDPAVRT